MPTYWQYLGREERVYTNVPVTVQRHDVVERDEIPADDGCWAECDAVNIENGDFTVKAPDNAPVEVSIVDEKTEE